MATFVASAVSNGTVGTTAVMPTHQAGDALVVWNYRVGSTAGTTLVSGWTNISSGSGTNTSYRLAYKIAANTADVTGTWTSANATIVSVYRPQQGRYLQFQTSNIPVLSSNLTGNASSMNFGNSNQTIHTQDNTSILLIYAGIMSNSATVAAPTGSTLRVNTATTLLNVMSYAYDWIGTNTFPSNTQAIGAGGAKPWSTLQIEMQEIHNYPGGWDWFNNNQNIPVLSNSGHTIQAYNSGTTNNLCYSSDGVFGEKAYVEVRCDSVSNSALIGLSVCQTFGNDKAYVRFNANGQWTSSNTLGTTIANGTVSTFANGVTVGVAFSRWDNTAWVRIIQANGQAGNWNGNATANPATNTGSLPGIYLWDSNIRDTDQLFVNVQSGVNGNDTFTLFTDNFINAAPSGFQSFAPNTQMISFIGSSNGTVNATPVAHAVGDLLVACAFRDGTAVVPTTPTGWVGVVSGTTTNCGMVIATKIATATNDVMPSFTNATEVVCQVYRSNTGLIAFGKSALNSGSGTTPTYNNMELQNTDGFSWVASFLGHRSIDGYYSHAPTGKFAPAFFRTLQLDATAALAGFDTGTGVSGFNDAVQNLPVGGTTSNWMTSCIEIIPIYANNHGMWDWARQTAGTNNASYSGFQMSQGRLIASDQGGTGNYLYTYDQANNGPRYFEAQCITTGGGTAVKIGVGFEANNNQSFNYTQDGSWSSVAGGSGVAGTLPVYSNGDIISVAYDSDNDLVWVRNNTMLANGGIGTPYWNNNANANPATLQGGFHVLGRWDGATTTYTNHQSVKRGLGFFIFSNNSGTWKLIQG